MNKRRLLKMADLLLADAKARKGIKFDIGVVGRVDNPDLVYGTTPITEEDVKVDCGTTACAMGLAAISGAFKKAGLGYKMRYEGSFQIDMTWKGRRVEYWWAAMKLFDIDEKTANFLFTPLSYERGDLPIGAKGERKVAKRIRQLVAGKVKATEETAW